MHTVLLLTDAPLDVESRTGALFCQMCNDFVWDPTLEELRVRKIGTGSFSSKWLLIFLFMQCSCHH
jgi:hypothetical protein